MMLRTAFLLFPFVVFSQQPITLEDIWQKGTFQTKGIPGFNFQKDGVHFTRLEGTAIGQYDLRTGEKSGVIFDAAAVKDADSGWEGIFDAYYFSADESKILLASKPEPIYRWSKKANYFVFDSKTGKITALHTGAKQRYATFSPEGSRVAYVVDNDLYFKDLSSGNIVRITTDGKPNAIINGASDWVYEEEFELVRAFEWSPDGASIAFLRFDESEVPEMTMEMYRGGAYPELVTFKYPKVGEKNAVVTAWIYDLKTRKTQQVQTGAAPDDYLPRIAWTPANQLCLTWMNRHQNHQKLLLAEAGPGGISCRVLWEEKSKYYIDLHDVTFLQDGSGFLLQSEKSGFNHLYRYDMTGRETAAVTEGAWDMTAFYGADEKEGLVYFQAAAENPMQRELYSVRLNGKSRKKIGRQSGTNSAQFSSTFDYFVQTTSSLNAPPVYSVCDRKGKVLRVLEQNDTLKSRQLEFGTIPAEFFKVPVKYDDWQGELNGWMIKPTAPQFQNQKLPVLMFVYGGPGSQTVTDAWKGANYWWFQMLAQQGYVVVSVDNRGTGARGEEFKKMTYQQLGKMETQDQIEAAKYIGTLPFVDPARVGIFGWSYGGYMSSLCMLKGREVFKSGIAVAPVTNWKWYDSVYTERYMRTHQENPEGYEQNSPVNFANRLQGDYLLIHGLADDNVHFQHTVEMADALIAQNKAFDTMIYPNRNHGIGGGNAKIHLYTLMTNFLNEKLKGDTKAGARP
jgi:dipeptidyl-peptidase-4